jgi:hypothetical protein
MNRTKAIIAIVFLVLGIVSGISLQRYARSQAALMQEKTNHDIDRSRLSRIENSRALADSVEGLIMPKQILPGLNSSSGEIVNLDSLWSRTDGGPTLILLFSLLGCNACLNQELDLIESDSMLARGGLHVVYICTDSLDPELRANFATFLRARRLKFPAFLDSTDLLRRNLRITSFSIVELVVVNSRILYAAHPSSSDLNGSLHFFNKVRRIVNKPTGREPS